MTQAAHGCAEAASLGGLSGGGTGLARVLWVLGRSGQLTRRSGSGMDFRCGMVRSGPLFGEAFCFVQASGEAT